MRERWSRKKVSFPLPFFLWSFFIFCTFSPFIHNQTLPYKGKSPQRLSARELCPTFTRRSIIHLLYQCMFHCNALQKPQWCRFKKLHLKSTRAIRFDVRSFETSILPVEFILSVQKIMVLKSSLATTPYLFLSKTMVQSGISIRSWAIYDLLITLETTQTLQERSFHPCRQIMVSCLCSNIKHHFFIQVRLSLEQMSLRLGKKMEYCQSTTALVC